MADLRTFGFSLVARRSAADLADLLKARVVQAGGKVQPGTDLSHKGGPFGALAGHVDLPPEAVAGLRRAFDEQDDVDCFIGSTAALRPSSVLVSDMDSTIIGQECIDELADALGLRSVISEITERAMRGELDFESALTERVAMLKGLLLCELERTFEDRITLNPGARTLIRTVRANGHGTLLVSGGFTFFTSRVARLAGFEVHKGNTLIDDGAALTGEVARPILGREAKRTALLEAVEARRVAPENAIALGDGANDLDMIKAAGIGVAYHAKPVVAAEANASIRHTDLTAALYFQNYPAEDIVFEESA
ncbi:phosphoserine phosphatase SerB [Hyphomonas sp.]|uniref:phosphoserine phosphatase SerB n=1 Tax=Hyphomonas sp. TaxID=87 RepID=UPI00333ECCA4